MGREREREGEGEWGEDAGRGCVPCPWLRDREGFDPPQIAGADDTFARAGPRDALPTL